MPQVVRQEEPIDAFSMSSLWRTTIVQMEVYRDRPAPVCTMLLFFALIGAAVYRIVEPTATDPQGFGACLTPSAAFKPSMSLWPRYLLHFLWPLEPGYIRSFLANVALIVEGYSLEYEIGTVQFATLFLGIHLATSAIFLYFRVTSCHTSVEAALAGIAVVLHRVNPKIHSDGCDSSIRVPFAIEPRWHLWLILAMLLLSASDLPVVLAVHIAGFAVGTVCVLRDPEVWVSAWHEASRSFTMGAFLHIAFFLFAILFMPLTSSEPPIQIQDILNGRMLQLSWWRKGANSSAPLLRAALAGEVAAEGLFICKLMIAFACPLLLSPFRVWMKIYAGGCVLLAMYTMNSPIW
eukprot:CAMPEP_0172712590 /NCGR_PEP_ID=MMETSP1074-20121228/61186_1 /TAXON_ID=2916 /ORGANISM="Ceratium fusus, Strain PA161109" /LENGTH=348 /DNA_ID=CAMNT_0013536541 /DNA_START=64 /DNA_END=1107 /DNA_ORIENTATION=+